MFIPDFLTEAKQLAAEKGLSVDQVLAAYNIRELKRQNDILDSLVENLNDTIPNSIYRIADSLEAISKDSQA